MKTCKVCGGKVSNNEEYCDYCGGNDFYLVQTSKGKEYREDNNQKFEYVVEQINETCAGLRFLLRDYDKLIVYYRGLYKRGEITRQELDHILSRVKYQLPRLKSKCNEG